MFIGICGSICAGKHTVAQYLVEHHGFKHLYIEPAADQDADHPISPLGTTTAAATTTPHPIPPPANHHIGGDYDEEEDEEEEEEIRRPKNGYQRSRSITKLSYRSPRSQKFPNAAALLEHVTKSWRERWVTTSLSSISTLDIFARRPFFLLISVDAPVTVRWQRYNSQQDPRASISLGTFVTASDRQLFDPLTGGQHLMSRAAVHMVNTSPDVAHLFATLGKVDLLNPDRLRPSWDSYFMSLAALAAQRSNCMKRRVGCVLVREKRVISTGYNGTPRHLVNCSEGGCGRCNSGESSGVGLATCLCIHAEENALLEAGRERIREGAILYCDTCPCLTCSIKIVQVGISEVVYAHGYSMDGETAAVFRQAGVKLRQFIPPANGLIHLEKMELY